MIKRKSQVGGLFFRSASLKIRCLIASLVVSTAVLPFSTNATEPLDTLSVADTTIEKKAPDHNERDILCLARNIYFESRGQSLQGQKAVAFVTLNRVKDARFPKTICDVVHQQTKGTCQFSWVCSRGMRVSDITAFNQARAVASKVISAYNELKDPSHGALYFSARSVRFRAQSLSLIHI